jgi:hypothetical protein
MLNVYPNDDLERDREPVKNGDMDTRNQPALPSEKVILCQYPGLTRFRKSGLPSPAVSVAMFGLEMKRVVKQLPGKMFVRNN